MEITDIRIRKVEADGKLRAYVTVTFDDCFVVHNVKIIEGKSGRFIAMPSRKTKTGEYKDVAHPINSDCRKKIRKQVTKAYQQEVEKSKQPDYEPQDLDTPDDEDVPEII